MWQLSAVGPMFGQVGYFHKFEGREIKDKRPLDHYADEARKLFVVLDNRLAVRDWIMGDTFTIADIAMIGMVRNFVDYYQAGELVGYAQFAHVQRWLAACLVRPAVARGLTIPNS